MPLPLLTKTCPDCGATFRTIRTAQGSHRYCWQCRKKQWKLIHSNGYLTPRPCFRPPARPDERGTIQ
jgi:predicted amidophosphoribosyltransferase